jgi:uncharacterized protein YciI
MGRKWSCFQSRVERRIPCFEDKEMPMSQRSTTYYAVLRERGENWDARLPMRQQELWDEHAAFMNALVDDGFVVLGGPLGGGEKILLIIDAESEQAIEARLADDPWTPLGLLRIAKVERWEILLSASDKCKYFLDAGNFS